MANVTMTGFKAFGDIETNPTEKISAYYQERNDPRFYDIKVIDVSISAVDSYHASFHVNKFSQKHLLIHLGVNAAANDFQFERFAYNNKTFRIPDNCGAQPVDECINTSMQLDMPVESNFPALEMASLLTNMDLPVGCSTNPGRYICNYIYFQSLMKTQTNHDSQMLDVVFIHTPSESVCPIDKQVAFIDKVVEAWMSKFYGE